MNNRTKIFLPLIISVALLVGYSIHYFLSYKKQYIKRMDRTSVVSGKLDKMLFQLEYSYYKKIPKDSIEEEAIKAMLKNLDPHTTYIPSKEMKRVREDMQGHFSGIGVQFFEYEDTVMVVRPIPKGPSERVGILAGDRIITVDGDTIAGRKELKTDSIMKMLRGIAGSEVSLGIRRPNADTLQDFIVTRGDVKVSTIDVAYMIDDKTGYVKVNQFGHRTYYEFVTALLKLKGQKAQRIIVDLRGNTGGLLEVCIAMVNEFLEKGQLIVYTKGLHEPRIDRKANGKGRFKEIPLVVLIDSYSASASEIFSGAIQDHDRGVVVGRRSYGKGLVQNQIGYNDGSALRLTIAEYFTPSGRNIQKPFKPGDRESYLNDLNERYEHGEFAIADSIHFADSLKYKTASGRTVYGGGGIMPDVFVPLDTTFYSKYYENLQRKAAIRNFSFLFADRHRAKLSALKDYKAMEKYINNQNYMQKFIAFAAEKGVKKDAKGYNVSKKTIANQVKALIIRNIIDNEGFYPIYHRDDEILKAGMKAFGKDLHYTEKK